MKTGISWGDSAFEKRNKKFGAYQLRKSCSRSVSIGFLTTVFVLMAICAYPIVNRPNGGKAKAPTPSVLYPELKTPLSDTVKNKLIFPNNEPMFPGGSLALMHYLDNNVCYFPSARWKWQRKKEGRVTMHFVINETGEVEDVKVARGLNADCNNDAIRLIKAMPKWEPARHDGRPIKTYMSVPVSYYPTIANTPNGGKAKALLPILCPELKKSPVNSVENEPLFPNNEPMFPGGSLALMDYLDNNVCHSSSARWRWWRKKEGTVTMRFVINETGEVEDVKVDRGLNADCDNDAIRLIKAMPKWEPARREGCPVKTHMSVPVNYRLE